MDAVYRISRDRHFWVSHRPLWNIQKRIFLMVKPAFHSLNIHSHALCSHYFDEVLWDDEKNCYIENPFLFTARSKKPSPILFDTGFFFASFYNYHPKNSYRLFAYEIFYSRLHATEKWVELCCAIHGRNPIQKGNMVRGSATKTAFSMYELWK